MPIRPERMGFYPEDDVMGDWFQRGFYFDENGELAGWRDPSPLLEEPDPWLRWKNKPRKWADFFNDPQASGQKI
jgi:hypothetical protein